MPGMSSAWLTYRVDTMPCGNQKSLDLLARLLDHWSRKTSKCHLFIAKFASFTSQAPLFSPEGSVGFVLRYLSVRRYHCAESWLCFYLWGHQIIAWFHLFSWVLFFCLPATLTLLMDLPVLSPFSLCGEVPIVSLCFLYSILAIFWMTPCFPPSSQNDILTYSCCSWFMSPPADQAFSQSGDQNQSAHMFAFGSLLCLLSAIQLWTFCCKAFWLKRIIMFPRTVCKQDKRTMTPLPSSSVTVTGAKNRSHLLYIRITLIE